MQDIKSGVIIDDTNQELFRMLSYPKLYDSRKHHPGSLLETNRHPQDGAQKKRESTDVPMQDTIPEIIIHDTNQELLRMCSYPKLCIYVYVSRKDLNTNPGSLLETNRHPQVRWGTKKPKNLQTSTLDAWITYIEEFWLH